MLDFLEREKTEFGNAHAFAQALDKLGNNPAYLKLEGRFLGEIEICLHGTAFRITDRLFCKGEESFTLTPEMKISQIEILTDRASVEILLNSGRAGGSFSLPAEASDAPLTLVAPGLNQGLIMKL